MYLGSLSRTGFSYIGGIFAYVLAWILLGQSSEDNLSPNNWKDFTVHNTLLCLYIALHCIVLYYTVLYRAALHCTLI